MMALDNANPRVRNWFLLLHNHDETCFCAICRESKLTLMDDQLQSLRQQITHIMPMQREARLTAVFSITKQLILVGKRYKDVCLNPTNNPRLYQQFKSWAKKQPYYQRFLDGSARSKKEFDDHCDFVNDAASCAENWEAILMNLTDQRITNIEARTLIVESFARAASMSWCLYYNAKCGTRLILPCPNDEETYSSDDVENIFRYIVNSEVLGKIGHNSVVAASLMKSVTLKVIRHCDDNRELN